MLLVLRFIKLDEMQFITRSSCINRFEKIDSISIVSVIHLNPEEIRIDKSTSLKVSINDHTSRKIIQPERYNHTLNFNTCFLCHMSLPAFDSVTDKAA